MNKKILIIAIAILILLVGLGWAFFESSKPLPGEDALQDGREHKDGESLAYKFNPPTSGDHYSEWITKGFYHEPRPDGNVVHSLEHGYIIIWYDCSKVSLSTPTRSGIHDFSFNWIPAFAGMTKKVYAHELEEGTASGNPTPSDTQGMGGGSEGSPSAKLVDLPVSFRDGSCDSLKQTLDDFYHSDEHKLIVMPRIGMEKPLILTSWGKILRLASFDKEIIKKFINTYRDKGPEATNEP